MVSVVEVATWIRRPTCAHHLLEVPSDALGLVVKGFDLA
jgi:hypothetical protein